MNKTGLPPQQLELLQQLFLKYPAVQSVKLYGSRAKGTFHERSDIDLVAFGEGIDRFLIAELLLDLTDSNLPYAVDIQNYAELKNRELIEHIDRVGIVIFQREGM